MARIKCLYKLEINRYFTKEWPIYLYTLQILIIYSKLILYRHDLYYRDGESVTKILDKRVVFAIR